MNGTLYLAWRVSNKELVFSHLLVMTKDFTEKASMKLTTIVYYGVVSVSWCMKSLICLESDIVFITNAS